MVPKRLALVFAMTSSVAMATDIPGLQFAALDQPRINAYVTRTPGGAPIVADIFGYQTFNIEAYYDTGASGVLLSNNTADFLEIVRSTFDGQDVIFSDVGVGGADQFNVSEPLHIALAPFHPDRNVDDINDYQAVYTQHFGPIRTQIGPTNVTDPNPLLSDLDVFGMPTFSGKVVVLDPKPVDGFMDTMRTYVYDPGTPFNPALADTDPGIPATSRSVKLSYVSFDSFTTTTPLGAPPPTLLNNPFIGPNPFAPRHGPRDRTPPVKISFNGLSAEGSWLLDTGAAASILSRQQASVLGVTYEPGTFGTENPVLQGVPISEQFTLRIGGIGGEIKLAGFFLDSLLLRTEQGDRFNDNDPAHLRYLGAPVLVGDITLLDPATNQPFTLDGIFGMNFLAATAYFEEAFPIPIIDLMTPGPFNWVVIDDSARRLRLDLKPTLPTVPEPAFLCCLLAVGLGLRRRRARAT